MTADGRQLRASEHEHPDLFWALRGAGPNFGVATSLQFRLFEVGPEVLAGQIIYPFDNAVELLRFFRDFMGAAPDGFQCYPCMIRIPPVEPFPERFHGHPALDFVVYHVDPDAADFVQPLRELGETILDVVEPLAYTTLQQTFDAALPKGQRYYSKAHYLDELSDASIDTITAHATDLKGTFTVAYLEPLGGAIGKVDPSATAFGGRSAGYSFHILAGWVEAANDDAVMASARRFHDAMAPHATGGVYVNLLGDDEDERVPAAYGDNRNYTLAERYSRAVEYDIDHEAMTVRQVWSYGKDRGPETYSRIVSDVDYGPEEDHVFFSPGAVDFGGNYGKVVEIDRARGQVLFEATITPPQPTFVIFHRTERLSLYPEN